jgi:hypothetical protein
MTRGNVVAVDPAGIYLATVVPCYSADEHNPSESSGDTTRDRTKGVPKTRYVGNDAEYGGEAIANAEAAEARGNVVVFYELLTGGYAGRIARRWPVGAIQSISWSPCGSRIAVATSDDHCATVYRLRHGMWDNVRSALEAVRVNPEFWTRYPLFLHPFRPLSESERTIFKGAQMDEDGGGGMTSRSSLTAMSDSIDAILEAAAEAGGTASATGGSPSDERIRGMARTDRTGLTTARKRISELVVGNALDAARQNVVKKILLPADSDMNM